MYTIKLYDRFHNILDEIYEYSDLTYTKTLNGVGKCNFKVPLLHPKTTKSNYKLTNHIEVLRNESILFGGHIVQLDFSENDLQIGAYGYLDIFNYQRLIYKNYSEMKYSKLLRTLVNEINSRNNTGISLGYLDDNCITTQRLVENKDMALDKMISWVNSANYYIEVDDNRKFNFYTSKSRKTYYELIFGTEEDNIVKAPSLSQSIIEMANNVYSETTRQENEADITMTSTKQDLESIKTYGLFEGTYNANDSIVHQNTLDNYVQDELRKRSYPSNSIDLEIINSDLCPIYDLRVGDVLSIYLKPYFEFKDEVKILEITINTTDDTAKLTVGETLFKPNKPICIRYAK